MTGDLLVSLVEDRLGAIFCGDITVVMMMPSQTTAIIVSK
jgi:hypothetical protein